MPSKPQPATNLLTEAFKQPSFDFLQTIPKKKQDGLEQSFKEASRVKKDFVRAEQALLGILNDFPENPFVTARLVAFYNFHGQVKATQDMVNKTRFYAQSKKIPLERLL